MWPLPWAVRLPTALVALCNIFLVFIVARRLGASDAAAICASLLLGVTPAHLLHGRFACDYLLPVPCMLAWLILLVDARRCAWRMFAAGAALGLGLYTYIAAVVMMPVCLVLTYLTLVLTGERRVRPYAAVTAGFILPVLPLATYLVAVPQVYAGFTQRYGGASLEHHSPPARSVQPRDHGATVGDVSQFLSVVLLVRARRDARHELDLHDRCLSEGHEEILMPIGAYQILRNRRTPFTLLLLATFFAAPLSASLIPEPHAIDRALLLLPTGALIAAFGVDWLLMPRRIGVWSWAGRAVCAGLLVWMGVQFNDFYRDYLTDYPRRSSFWFDGNHPGAFEPIVRAHPRDDRRLIYLSESLPRVREHWKLYLLGHGRKDLLGRTVYFSQDFGLDVTWRSLLTRHIDDAVEHSVSEAEHGPGRQSHHRTRRRAGVYAIRTNAGDRVLPLRRDVFRSGDPQLLAGCRRPSVREPRHHGGVSRDGNADGGKQSRGRHLWLPIRQTAITDDGVYAGITTGQGIQLTGQFATTGTFRLAGNGAADGNQYQLTLFVKKRQ